MTPHLVEGGIAIDDRGTVIFANDVDLSSFRRFYLVTNHSAGFVRAWHGHKIERKIFVVIRGSMLIGAAEIDDWESPSTSSNVVRVILSASKPSALCIPAGFANGSMSLTQDAQLLVFSSLSLQESESDDYRFPANYWDIWAIQSR